MCSSATKRAIVSTLWLCLIGCDPRPLVGAAPLDGQQGDNSDVSTGDTSTSEVSVRSPDALCQWRAPEMLGTLSDPRVPELSGLAASSRFAGWFWGHNDSGEKKGRLFLIDDEASVRAEMILKGIKPVDWEDLASGPCMLVSAEGQCLWVGDIGDNNHKRQTLLIHRVKEPDVQLPLDVTEQVWTTDAETFSFRYPEDPAGEALSRPDAEALFVDQEAIWLLTKRDDGVSRLFRVEPTAGATVYAQLRGSLDLRHGGLQGGLSLRVTAADLRDGKLAVRTYFRLALFDFTDVSSRGGAHTPTSWLDSGFDVQGESLTWSGEDALVHGSEGVGRPLWRLRCLP